MLRKDVVAAAERVGLWPVEDEEAWCVAARTFQEDRAKVTRVADEVPKFNKSGEMTGWAFVDLVLQAHCKPEGVEVKRNTKTHCKRLACDPTFLSKEVAKAMGSTPSMQRRPAENPCEATTAAGARCRNAAKYSGRCFVHRHKCKFFIIEGGEEPKACGKVADDSELCPLHAHRIDVVLGEEEAMGLPSPGTEKGKVRCKGKSRLTGKDCRLFPKSDTKYCRHHQDQDENYETNGLAYAFEEVREEEEQEAAIENLEDLDEYAVASYMLLKKSNQFINIVGSALSVADPKHRYVDLTIYPGGISFKYPNKSDNEEGKLLQKFKIDCFDVVLVPSVEDSPNADERMVRFEYKGTKGGARYKDFINVKDATAKEIRDVLKHLKGGRPQDVLAARKVVEDNYKEKRPYRRWFDQVIEACKADPTRGLRSILCDRNDQWQNHLGEGFTEEEEEFTSAATEGAPAGVTTQTVYWWGTSRNKRTGRKIGTAEDKEAFIKELRERLDEDDAPPPAPDPSQIPMPNLAPRASRPDALPRPLSGTEKTDIGEAGAPASLGKDPVTDEGGAPWRTWFYKIVKDCREKASLKGDPGAQEYEVELNHQLKVKFKLNKSDRLRAPLTEFNDGNGTYYWWDRTCKAKWKIGTLEQLQAFAAELEQIFPSHFRARDARADPMLIHAEERRPTWSKTTKEDCWRKLRRSARPLTEKFAEAFGITPDRVPDFVRDDLDSSEFRVDMYGNVVASVISTDKGPAQNSVCFTEYDHILPWARGGMSKGVNVESISWMANRKKTDRFIHGAAYAGGWTSGEGALNLGLSTEQFVSLFKDIRDKIMKSRRAPRLAELRNDAQGKKLVEKVLYEAPAVERSWDSLSRMISGAGIMERPTGALLRFILDIYATAVDSESFEKNCIQFLKVQAGVPM